MGTLRQRDYKHDSQRDHELEEGVEAFASEDEIQPTLRRGPGAPLRSRWSIALGIAALIVAGLLIIMRDWGSSSGGQRTALLPARTVVAPGDARIAPPALETQSVATTGRVIESARREPPAISVTRKPASQTLESAEGSVPAISSPPVVEPAPPPPPAEPEEVPTPVASETVTIVAHARDRMETDDLLRAYADSYNRMDVASMVQVWPTVDTGALSRAFSTLSQQHLAFDSCDVEFVALRARAECAGEVRYVPRVGDPTPRVLRRTWTIEMQRSADRWQIAAITVR